MLKHITFCFALSVLFLLSPTTPGYTQGKVDGSVQAARRSFNDAISGPKSRVFAGVNVTIKVVSGQADINFRHRERRKCKWYGKCWYERWIDHNFKSPTTNNMWPISYQLVDDNGNVVSETKTTTPARELTISAPKSATEFNKSYRLQARFADTPQPIDPNRTNGVFGLEVSFDSAERIKTFPDFLNNGTFLPLAREIEQMLQLDVWTREQGKSDLARALVNYARVFFPTEDSLKQTEHFKLLEIAQGLDPNSDSVSRALVDHYVARGDFSSASDEIRSKLAAREEELKANPNNREQRLSLSRDYAFLAALTEREGTLLTSKEYERLDSLFDRAVRHAERANSREVLSRILSSRAEILRKTNTGNGLSKAIEAQEKVVKLLGQSFNGELVSLSPDKRYALISKAPASTGMINQPIASVQTDQILQSNRIEHPDMLTKRSVKPLDLGASGDVLIDDGGILSLMRLDESGTFKVTPIENVLFNSAGFYENGIFGISRGANGYAFSFLPNSMSLESIPFGGPNDLDTIHVRGANDDEIKQNKNKLPDIFNFSSSEKSNEVVIIGKGVNPDKRAFKIVNAQALPVSLNHWDLTNARVEKFVLSPTGTHLAAFVFRSSSDDPPQQIPSIEIVPLDGAEPKIFRQIELPENFKIGETGGLVFSQNGSVLAALSNIVIVRIVVESGLVSPTTAVSGVAGRHIAMPSLFGLDNEGALIAAVSSEDGYSGTLFRLVFDQVRDRFGDNPQRLPVANRILQTPNIVILANDGELNIGVPRHTFGEFAVIDLSNGPKNKSAGRAVHYDSSRLLSGGRFILSVDNLSNSVIIHDLDNGDEFPPINPVSDLVGLIDNDGVTLQPRVIALRSADEWALLWSDTRTGGIEFVSKYKGAEKFGDTLTLGDAALADVSQQLSRTLETEPAKAAGFGSEPKAIFVLADAEQNLGSKLSTNPLITVKHALSDIPTLEAFNQIAEPELKGPLKYPIVNLEDGELAKVEIESERYGTIIGFDQTSASVLFARNKQLFLRDNKANIKSITPTNAFGDPVETPKHVVFMSNSARNGNLAGAVVAFLMENSGRRVRADYRFFDTSGVEAMPCRFCSDVGTSNKVAQNFNLLDLVGMVDISNSTFALPINDKLMIFTPEFGTFPIDELPLGLARQLSHASRHVVQIESGASQIFIPVSD